MQDYSGLIIGGLGGLAAVITALAGRRKGKSDAKLTALEVQDKISDMLWERAQEQLADKFATQDQLDAVQAQVTQLQRERTEAIEHVDLLERTGTWPTPPGVPRRPVWMQKTEQA